MKQGIIGILSGLILIYNLALAQVPPHPERYRIIYGNRDGSQMSVQLGDTIQFPVWGTTDLTDSVDTVIAMFNPLKSSDAIIPQRFGGYCFLCQHIIDPPCRIGDLYHSGDSTSQPIILVPALTYPPVPMCTFDTFGDTVQIGYFTMSITDDSSFLGEAICPFTVGTDPVYGSLLWGFADGLTQVVPVATYGGLYFTTCNAIPGDANGDGVFNAIDIVYGVNFLKGSGNPPQSWDCPGHGSVFVGADANGNCVFNGLDVTYSVNYLLGHGPAPRRCPDC